MTDETNTPLWGCPWHGVIRWSFGELSGDQYLLSTRTLELSDGSEIDWPSISSSVGNIAHIGTSFMQRLPGAATDPQTPPELAAQGMEWRDYALVGGGLQSEVHDKNLGSRGWYYWDAAMGWPWKLNLSVRRIGSINAFDCETYDLTVSADPSGFILKPWAGFEKTVRLTAEQTAEFSRSGWQGTLLRYSVVDAVPDGSKIIIGVYNGVNLNFRERSDSLTINDVTALGFWLLEITGSPFAGGLSFELQATELASRTDCLGSVSYTPMPTAQVMTNVFTAWDRQGFTIDWPPRPYPQPSVTPGPIVSRAYLTEQEIGTETRTLTGKVVGYWFDEQGVPLPVTLSREATRERSSTYSEQIISDTLKEITDSSGGWSYEGTAEGAATRVVTEINRSAITLTWGDSSLSDEVVHTRTITYDWRYKAENGNFPSGTGPDLFGITYQVDRETPAGLITEGPTSTNLSAANAPAGLPATPAESSSSAYECTIGSWPTVARWCDKAFGAVCRGSDSSEIAVGRVLTPGGIKGAGDYHPITHKYGAYQPVTGELLIAQRAPVRFT
tara:strand:+ start:3401 stop:5071 length:1671 start_codon:yes stop_codon:yes gene_type:complete